MLRLLHRHILREVVVATLLTLGLFVFVLIAGNALRDSDELLLAGRLDGWIVLRLIGLLIPYVAAYALPLAVLTGTLVALGRLSSQREITAMKSAGVHLLQIAASVFFVALIGLTLTLVVNFRFAPEARVAYKTLLADAMRDDPLNLIEPRRFITAFPGFVLYMGEREGDALKDFWIWELNQQRQVTLFLRAASGNVQFDEDTLALVLTLRDGNAEQRNPDRPEAFSEDFGQSLFFEELAIALPLERILNPGSQRRRLKEMTFGELQAMRSELLAQERAGILETPRPGAPSDQRLRVQMQIQNHFAMAFSVFSLAILGIPLAIQIGRKETYANITLALILAITYYFLMIVISWLEAQPALRPDLLLWLPNITFQAIGAYGLYRAAQK